MKKQTETDVDTFYFNDEPEILPSFQEGYKKLKTITME